MGLKYTPALSSKDLIIFENVPDCFINPVRSPPSRRMLTSLETYPYLFCDSGGYQIYKIKYKMLNGEDTERFEVIYGAGIQRYNGVLILDPIDLCEKYGELNVKCGFTLDFPLVVGTSEEYEDHLFRSYECAAKMFDCQQDFCADTDLFIPLHFSTQKQLHIYFNTMSTLNPDGYAFPVRDNTNWEYLMKICYTLSFLHAKGVQKVHMFGSCKPEIIIIGAAALGLQMFQQITFDSSTWDTARNNPPKYLDPGNLRQRDIRDLKTFMPHFPKSFTQKIKGYEKYLPKSYFYKLIGFSNVQTVNHYTKKMVSLAQDVEKLKWFVRTNRDLKSVSPLLMHSIGLLQSASGEKNKCVEEDFEYIWH